jgi:hypothetical protein
MIDLLNAENIQLIRDRTRAYRESQREPEWYQIVRDELDHGVTESIMAFVSRLGIPESPPEPKRPGVGVMMWCRTRKHPYLILGDWGTHKQTLVTFGEDSFWKMVNVEDDRPATDEEITAFCGEKR